MKNAFKSIASFEDEDGYKAERLSGAVKIMVMDTLVEQSVGRTHR